MSPNARNCRFHLTGCRTRDGIQNQFGFVLPDGAAVTGLGAQKVRENNTTDVVVPIAFSGLGNLYIEQPAGSGRAYPINNPLITLPENASMQVALAFKRHYLAFTDLTFSKAQCAVYNPILNTLDPLSMKPVGSLWQAATQYQVGETVCPATPVGGNGHVYTCIVPGVSGANQPNFPTTEGGTIGDGIGALEWKENTPVMAQALPEPAIPVVTKNAGAGAFAAGRDVYIIVTLVNPNGETDGQTALAYVHVNTALNDQFVVPSPPLPNWVQALVPEFAATGYNVYEADVATGNPAPSIASYLKVNGATVAFGTPTDVNTSGSGAAPPTSNTATVVQVGNICTGLRYMVVLFINRNGYFSGMSQASVITYNAANSGLELFVPHLPIGPPNTIARVCCFTPAGQLNQLAGTGISNAGPYFYINPSTQFLVAGNFNYANVPGGVTIADVVNGVQMTSTVICDNVSTTATFNFTDDYLKSTLNEVSDFFFKIQVPPCADIYYSETLRRMFYAADTLPSGWYISLQDDPETVYGDTGLIQAAENNSENRTAVREYNGIVYLMKEKSGYTLAPSTDDPDTWTATQQWTGSGPCGPRAVDVCSAFMCYVHRSGVWIFQGSQPFCISKEIPAHTGVTWKNINWKAQSTIWVLIDDETKEIRIGVPYGNSAVPNIVLKCNYEESPNFEPPIHFSPYIGKEIATGTCRKWSIDDIPANLAIRAERPLLNPPALMDNATAQSQILYASSNPDGAVSAIVPYMFNDNGQGIDWVYETACPQNLMKPHHLAGVQANVDGQGQLPVSVLSLRAKDPKDGGAPPVIGKPAAVAGTEIRLKKPIQAGIPYACGGRLFNERLRLRITNDKKPDTWGDIKWACIYAVPDSDARPR